MIFNHGHRDFKPRRRWLRFSLRTLLLAVTLLCVWLGLKVYAARRQCEAVTAILNAGGDVMYDYRIVPGIHGQRDDTLRKSYEPPPGPAWLRNLIGDAYFCDVVAVQLPKSDQLNKMAAADVQQLPKLPALRTLTIFRLDRPLQWEELAAIGELRSLYDLQFDGIDFVNSELVSLVKLNNLRILEITNARIGDSEMEQIGTMTWLEALALDYDRITDTGFSHIKNLRNLESLSLRSLYISNTAIGRLDALPTLRTLDLSFSAIGDSAVPYLGRLKHLTKLNLYDTDVTDRGESELRASLPATSITGR